MMEIIILYESLKCLNIKLKKYSAFVLNKKK